LNDDGSWDSWSKTNGVGSSNNVDEEIRWAVKTKPRFAKAQYWFLCVLIANTGIRPAEVIKLRHRDLSLVRSSSDERVYTIIEIQSDVSKVGKFRDVIASDFHQTFERYLDYRREIEFRFGIKISPEDYLFPSSENYEERRERLSNIVRPNLQRIGLHKKVSASDPNVETFYSAYSFRSWYITQRLKNGLDIYTLAKNCGTSIQTIASTYDYSENWAYRKAMTSHINKHSSGDEPKTDLSAYIKNWK
jgi:integrase